MSAGSTASRHATHSNLAYGHRHISLCLLLGHVLVNPFISGLVIGYIYYDTTHYLLHHFTLKNHKLALWLKKHHLGHHYKNEYCGFGISSLLWDYIFGTMPPNKKRR
ncbi:MAG: hypothetical protein GKR87_11095 [Kiritimatiellae bacterium]|nr:hypothetical protein [Kiritimatiellia bacterium]